MAHDTSFVARFPRLRLPALMIAGTVLTLWAGTAPASELPNAQRPRAEQFNCLPLDEKGATKYNPNAAFICSQVDALRNDCELQRLQTDVPVMNTFHCFDWRMEDVRPGVGGQRNPSGRASEIGGGGGGGSR